MEMSDKMHSSIAYTILQRKIKELDMFPLHKQRIREVMIEVYKILNHGIRCGVIFEVYFGKRQKIR